MHSSTLGGKGYINVTSLIALANKRSLSIHVTEVVIRKHKGGLPP